MLAEGEGAVRVKCRALWYSRDPHRNSTLYLRNNEKVVYAPPTGDPRPIDIMDVDEIPLLGQHNVDNVMAATLMALAAGVQPKKIRESVISFKALPHRLTEVSEIGGVRYIDDSKATNPGSVIAALRTFDDGHIVLIAGGKAKGTDFADFGKAVSSRARAVVLIGAAADDMASVIKRAKVVRETRCSMPSRLLRSSPSRVTSCCSRRAVRRSTCSNRQKRVVRPLWLQSNVSNAGQRRCIERRSGYAAPA